MQEHQCIDSYGSFIGLIVTTCCVYVFKPSGDASLSSHRFDHSRNQGSIITNQHLQCHESPGGKQAKNCDRYANELCKRQGDSHQLKATHQTNHREGTTQNGKPRRTIEEQGHLQSAKASQGKARQKGRARTITT